MSDATPELPSTAIGGDLGRIKGAAFREFVAWYERTYGQRTLQELARTLYAGGELDHEKPTLGLLSSRWYSARTVHALLDTLVHEPDRDSRRALARQTAGAVLDGTIKGVYRMLFAWIATPERYARFAPALWDSYFDTGIFEVSEYAPGRTVAHVRDWRSHHPFLCEVNREAAVVLYRAMGCKNVKAERVACVDDGAPSCTFVTTWSPER